MLSALVWVLEHFGSVELARLQLKNYLYQP